MKVYFQVACSTLIVVVLLVGCGGTAATPEVVDTVVVPPESPTSLPPSATQPPPSPTMQAPTETQSPPTPTLPPPTDTPPPAVTETPVSSPMPPQVNLPMAGVWTGGGTNLLVDFEVQINAGQATVSNVGILWEGRGECELNARLDVSVPVDESGFVLNYIADEFSVVMNGALASSAVFTGVLNIKLDDCGDQQVNWQAMPKPSAGQ